MSRRPLITMTLGLGLLVIALLVGGSRPNTAVGQSATAAATPSESQAPKLSNAYCLLCHAQTDQVWTLPSGEKLPLVMDAQALAKSVHGDSNKKGALQCVDCHLDYKFPHPVDTSQTLREFRLERYATCRTCHEDQYTRSQDSVHGAALRAGQQGAAVCVDCHGSHDIQSPNTPRARISTTCGNCHKTIFNQYRDSVHGKALLTENNPDVPTCIDCHGVHNIQDPTTALFRVRSPELCSRCHSDAALMAKYNISTNVMNSYLTDFHGSTVALFRQQDPKTPTNKAVCYDCHGVHDIQPVEATTRSTIRQNLLATCQQCHPRATASFPDAWIGHYPATATAHPVLFAVNTLYSVLIPLSIGILLLLIVVGIFGRIRAYRRRGA